MKRIGMSLLGITVLLLAGCKTTEVKPVEWKDKSAFMTSVKDPRRYGYSIYQTPRGVEYRGGSRLHPNQAKSFSMEVEEPFRPVVMLPGKYGRKTPFLLDFTMESSWMEFGLARALGAVPVSEGAAELITMPGEEFPGCFSMVPRLRLGHILVENPLVYVRMATGPLGSLARDIDEPEIMGVLGWNLLKKFEQIHLNYVEGQVAVSTTKVPYDQDPALVIAKIPMVKHTGACLIRGTMDGKPALILVDPAGDFEVATDGGEPIATLELGDGLTVSNPAVSKSIGGTRLGAQFLRNYKLTLCPQEGLIYFEKPPEKEKSFWWF